MGQNKKQFQPSQQGSGSSDGESSDKVSTISGLGGLSGRDDSSGGGGDRMEDESSNEATDKPSIIA